MPSTVQHTHCYFLDHTMGPRDLWATFQDSVADLEGANALRVVEGKVIAIDASVWIVEAVQQQQMRKKFDPRRAVLKLFFDRIVRLLTVGGATLVVVLEGDSRGDRSGRCSSRGGLFRLRCEDVAMLSKNMGVACVQAEGEGEACCAALAAAGLVNGIATPDSDVLAFGLLQCLNNQTHGNGPMRACGRSGGFESVYVFKELHVDVDVSNSRVQVPPPLSQRICS